MSTLADEFLADLDDLEAEENQIPTQKAMSRSARMHIESDRDGENDDSEDMDSDDMNELNKAVQDYIPGAVAHIRQDPQFLTHMENINRMMEQNVVDSEKDFSMNLEENPEYALVLKTNNLLSKIGEEIKALHHAVFEIYKNRFPELERLVPHVLDYLRLVIRIQNETDMNNVKMDDIISPSLIMGVALTGSTSIGELLSEKKLKKVIALAEEALQLDEDRALLLRFIESRMSKLAPNVSALVGTHIAARIVGQVGGLKSLSTMPSCNVMLVGQQKQSFEGFGMSAPRHTGILFQADLVQDAPQDLRMKASRVLANKLTLAARIDAQGSCSNDQGTYYRHEIQEKIDKWQQPSIGMREKPLPIPGDAPKKKRGGRRVRKQKEERALTETMKRMNRVGFGVAPTHYADEAMGVEYGTLEQGTGDIRGVVTKKIKLSQKTLKKIGDSSKKGFISGLASSFDLADAQGIELISGAKKRESKESSYFNVSSGFSSVGPGKISANQSQKREHAEVSVQAYVPKRERKAVENDSEGEYTPELTMKLNWRDIDIDENLMKFSKQSFSIKSKTPTEVQFVLSGHTNVITALRWHPTYGHLLASASLDSTIRLWSVFPNKGEVLTLSHKEGVKDIQWSANGHVLFSGGLDHYVNVTDIESGKCLNSYKHTEWVTSLCPHPTNPYLFLSGGQRRGIVCWDTRVNGVVCEYFAEFGEVQDMAFLDNNGDSFVSTAEITKRNSTDKGIIAWDFRSGAPLSNQIYFESYSCSCIRKHPLESTFIAQSTADYIALFQSTKPYRLNRKKRYGGHRVNGYKVGMSFSSDGEIIATGSSGGSVYFYNYHTSHILSVMKAFNQCTCTCAEYHPLLFSTVAIGSWKGKLAILHFNVC